MAGTHETVEIYDGNDRVATVPVVDGKWTAPLTGLAPGWYEFSARVGELHSQKTTVFVNTALDFLDFHEGKWGSWTPVASGNIKHIIGQEGDNQHAVITSLVVPDPIMVMRATISGFVAGERYRIKFKTRRVSEEGSLTLHVRVVEKNYPIIVERFAWKQPEVEFVAPGSSVYLAILIDEQSSKADFHLDDIRVYKVPG